MKVIFEIEHLGEVRSLIETVERSPLVLSLIRLVLLVGLFCGAGGLLLWWKG